MVWRRGRDSNPRGNFRPPNDLANRPLQPLGYLSIEQTHCTLIRYNGGRGGIRTHGTVSGTPVFKTGALDHYATLPIR